MLGQHQQWFINPLRLIIKYIDSHYFLVFFKVHIYPYLMKSPSL